MKDDIWRILFNIHTTVLSFITSLAETTGFLLEKIPILYASYPFTVRRPTIPNSNNYYANMFVAKIQSMFFLVIKPLKAKPNACTASCRKGDGEYMCIEGVSKFFNPNAKYENVVALLKKRV